MQELEQAELESGYEEEGAVALLLEDLEAEAVEVEVEVDEVEEDEVDHADDLETMRWVDHPERGQKTDQFPALPIPEIRHHRLHSFDDQES